MSINRNFIHLSARRLVIAALALGLALVNVTPVRADSCVPDALGRRYVVEYKKDRSADNATDRLKSIAMDEAGLTKDLLTFIDAFSNGVYLK
jgi:hypothetical protein